MVLRLDAEQLDRAAELLAPDHAVAVVVPRTEQLDDASEVGAQRLAQLLAHAVGALLDLEMRALDHSRDLGLLKLGAQHEAVAVALPVAALVHGGGVNRGDRPRMRSLDLRVDFFRRRLVLSLRAVVEPQRSVQGPVLDLIVAAQLLRT